jgi:hypothetical protein
MILASKKNVSSKNDLASRSHKREKQGPLKKAYLFFLQHCSIIER